MLPGEKRHPIEIEKYPRWAMHYIQEIEIVDATTGKTVETVILYSN
jgi:hypothetical protein